jgi:hypothetical protein
MWEDGAWHHQAENGPTNQMEVLQSGFIATMPRRICHR